MGMMSRFAFSIVIMALMQNISCGVKSKPLAPLKEPWISSGNLEKDRDKRLKPKKQPPPENRVEFGSPALSPPAFDEKKEL